MKTGKLSPVGMSRSVFKQLHNSNEYILQAPAYGEDAGILQISAGGLTVATATNGCRNRQAAKRAAQTALNNLWAAAAKPMAISTAILLPTSSSEQELRVYMAELSQIAEANGLAILSGQTEVTRAVKTPQITVTAFGMQNTETPHSKKNIRPGMDLVVTKWIGLEGTELLTEAGQEKLLTRYSQPFLDKAKEFEAYLSVASEAAVALESGACAMHDLSEGGIFGGLWEMAEAAGVGLDIDLKKIPIRQETVEICEFFGVNPYKLLSTGSLVIAIENGEALIEKLYEKGIPGVCIGRTTEGNDRILHTGEDMRFLESAQMDEMIGILNQLENK